jgi:hypothetical protein
LHHVGSLYILTYDAQKIKHKIVAMFGRCVLCEVCAEEEETVD